MWIRCVWLHWASVRRQTDSVIIIRTLSLSLSLSLSLTHTHTMQSDGRYISQLLLIFRRPWVQISVRIPVILSNDYRYFPQFFHGSYLNCTMISSFESFSNLFPMIVTSFHTIYTELLKLSWNKTQRNKIRIIFRLSKSFYPFHKETCRSFILIRGP
jgi:hypothetical protein